MTDIFTLGIKADTSDLNRGKKDIDKFSDSAAEAESATLKIRDSVNTAGKAVAAFGVTAAAAMGVLLNTSANASREIENLSRVTGLNTEEFQRAAFAANAYGIEQDKLADILKDVQDKVGDFIQTGAGPMVDFFEKIAPRVGVTADQFRNLNGKDALQLYASSLEKANLAQSDMVFFMEAIASDALLLQPLLANNGAEFLRLADRAETLGLVLDNLDIKNLSEMKTALGEVAAVSKATANIFSATLAPFVTELANEFNSASIEGDVLREVILDVAGVGVRVAGVFADSARVFQIAGTAIGAYAFTVVEGFDTIEARMAVAAKHFEIFGAELSASIEAFAVDTSSITSQASNFLLDFFDLTDSFDPEPIELPSISDESKKELATLREELTSLEDVIVGSNDLIKDSWQDVLDLMAQPLPSDGFTKWFDTIEKTIVAQRALQDETKKTGQENKKVVDLVGSDSIKYLSNIKEVTKGLGTAFGENEKAAKALHKVNTVISIIEQAMILEKVFADSAATSVHIANSTAKATANGVEAITAAAAAPFPLGFGAAATMIGLISSLGVFGGGGGGGSPSLSESTQESQGTGTLLGSGDKSQSILKSQDRFEDIAIDQLAELRGIRDGINGVAAGIDMVAGGVSRGGLGDFSGKTGSSGSSIPFLGGLFGKTSKSVVDSGINFVSQSLGEIIDKGIINAESFFAVKTKKKSFFGLVSSSKTKIETQSIDSALNEQMAAIFGSIGQTVVDSAKQLGFETVTVTKRDVIQGIRTKFDREFTSVFSQVEVSIDDALSRFKVDIGRVSFEGLSGSEIQEELRAIFSQQSDLIAEFLVPSIAEYQKIGEGLFDTLTRVTQEQVIFIDSLEHMGMSLSDLSNVMQIDVAQSVISLIGGVERFSDLTSSFFSEFFTEAEQFDMLSSSLTEAVESLGLSMFETRDQFRDMIEGIDLTTEAGQALFAGLLELNPAMAELFDALDSQAANELAEAERELTEERNAERDALRELAEAEREAQAETRALESAVKSAFSGLSASVRAEQKSIGGMLRSEMSDIDSVFSARRDDAQKAIDRNVSSMERQISISRSQASGLSALSNTIGSAISQIQGINRSQAREDVRRAISLGKRGGSLSSVNISESIGALSQIDESEFGSALEFQVEQARTAGELRELKKLTDGQLSVAERSERLLERQIQTIESAHLMSLQKLDDLQAESELLAQEKFEAESATLTETLDIAKGQLDALTGVDSSVLSVTDAVEAFNASLISATQLNQVSMNDNITKLATETAAAINDSTKPLIKELSAINGVLNIVSLNVMKSTKIIDNWDGRGLPQERTG